MTAPRQIKSAARRRAMQAGDALRSRQAIRAVIYVRMSIDRTGEGAGLERQTTACRALCVARGWDVVAVVDDTVSATDARLGDRTGWQKVVSIVEAGEADVIVAYHLDRVTRSMADLDVLVNLAVERNIGLTTAVGDIDLTTDAGRMVARILAAVAAAEGERKAERMVLANDQRVAAGRPQWIRRPFGFEMDGKHRADEAEAIRQAYADVFAGKPIGRVAKEWNAAGYRTSAPAAGGARALPEGVRKAAYRPTGLWSHVAVRDLLVHPRNAGIITLYDEEAGKGQWEPIVDETLFRAVQLLVDGRRLGPGTRSRGPATLLSAIMTCSRCNQETYASADAKKGPIYRCRKGCTQIERAYPDDEVRDRMVQRAVKLGRTSLYPTPVKTVDVEPLKARELEIHGLMAELVADRSAGLIDRAAMVAGTADLRAELADVQRRIADAGRAAVELKPKPRLPSAGDLLEQFAGVADRLRAEWDAADLYERRTLVGDAYASIVLTPPPAGRPTAARPALHPGRIEHTWSLEWDTMTLPSGRRVSPVR